MIFPLFHILRSKICPVGLKRCSRNGRRHHHIDTQRNILCSIQNIFHRFISFYIDQFMGISNDRCRSMGHDCLCKLQRRCHRGLNMHMGIDKPRTEIFPLTVHFLLPGKCSDSYDLSIRHRKISPDQFSILHINNRSVF